MTRTVSGCLIVGIGNAFRGDDGVGICVARQLGTQLPAGVSVLESNGEAATLLEAWTGATCVFLVDALESGAAPGTIRRIDATAGPVLLESFRGSSHSFGIGEAVELGRALNELPQQLIIYGIEGGSFGHGAGLSGAVSDSAAKVVEEILGEIHAWESECAVRWNGRHAVLA